MDIKQLAWLLLTGCVLAAGASAQELPSPAEGFLCCNMHAEDDWISDINYRDDRKLVPLGTPVKAVGYGRQRVKVDMAGKPMALGNDYSRKLDLRTFAQRYIVADDPRKRLEGFSAEVQESIKAVQLRVGMTREQVLMAVSYPVAKDTPDLAAAEWRYWVNGDEEFKVRFDDSGAVREIHGSDKALAKAAPSLLDAGRLAAAQAGEQPCAINLYRPNATHWNTPRMRPDVYVDGKKVGTLALGESHCLALEPGVHEVATRESFGYFIPGNFSGKRQVNIEIGAKPVFLRYTKDIAGVTVIGMSTVVNEKNELVDATEAQWRARE